LRPTRRPSSDVFTWNPTDDGRRLHRGSVFLALGFEGDKMLPEVLPPKAPVSFNMAEFIKRLQESDKTLAI